LKSGSKAADPDLQKSGADRQTVRSQRKERLLPSSPGERRSSREIIARGPAGYKAVFEKVLGAVCWHDFNIAYVNRYEGRIESAPLLEPGEQPRVRRRAVVVIRPGDQEGVYEVQTNVLKEKLGPESRPGKMVWIPDGRDEELEAAILRGIAAKQ
jgi:hypothetical protein